jgi:hypothetical protein
MMEKDNFEKIKKKLLKEIENLVIQNVNNLFN